MTTMNSVNYINNTELGKIKSWTYDKKAAITPISFPGKDAGLTEGVDTLGVIAFIKFTAKMTGDFESIQDNLFALQNILDGKQTTASVLYSPFINAKDRYGDRKQGAQSTVTSVAVANTLADNTANFSIQGVAAGDKVKNLTTGQTTTVTSVTSDQILAITDDIFTETGQAYAVTVNIKIKLTGIKIRWELPGLGFCTYDLEAMQVSG